MLKKILMLAVVAAFFTACTETKDTVYVPVDSGSGKLRTQTFTVDIQGPGGHSNGAYGAVNSVHAAARIMVALDDMKPAASFNLLNISGGNSVNSIAGNGKIIVQAVGTVEQLKAFDNSFRLAVNYGLLKENDFREVHSGQTNVSGKRLDVRLLKDIEVGEMLYN